MTRNNFFKTLLTLAAVAVVKPLELFAGKKEPGEKLEGKFFTVKLKRPADDNIYLCEYQYRPEAKFGDISHFVSEKSILLHHKYNNLCGV